MSRIAEPSPLTPQVLLRAYSIGLFPMAESAQDAHVFWVDPQLRGIFPLDGLIISSSLAKALRSERFQVRIDADFDAVIDACAQMRPDASGTWINPLIRTLYRQLFDLGHVHTVETYFDGALVGGLYGVALGAAFCGESMFHRKSDASKVALVHLVAHLKIAGFVLLDTQFLTPHLESLGAVEISRAEYHERLAVALALASAPLAFGAAAPLSGKDALNIVSARTAVTTPPRQ